MVLWFHAVAIFLGAALLFMVQPMFSRLVQPLLGGTPAVWSVCLVFFQAALLGGYLYAHWLGRWFHHQRGPLVHMGIMLVGLVFLPIAIPAGWEPPASENPTWWLLGLLTVVVGLPFMAVAATAPLLQNWLADDLQEGTKDPYFLYAVSNGGSLLGLLSYPFAVERLTLPMQSYLWSVGYSVLLATIFVGWALRCRSKPGSFSPESILIETSDNDSLATPLTWQRRLTWIILAFVPTSYLQGVTTYLTTDLAAIPLFWVIPLTVYLLTFIIAFIPGKSPRLDILVMVLPWLLLPILFPMLSGISWYLVPVHLLVFFLAGLICHGQLAADRPHPKYLTEFYLLLSLGGALGGAFNALLAPLLFRSVAEYPLAVLLLLLVCPSQRSFGRWEYWASGLVGIFALTFLFLGHDRGIENFALVFILSFGVIPMCLGSILQFSPRVPMAMGGALYCIWFVMEGGFPVESANQLFARRSFFGVHRIRKDTEANLHLLSHGSTVHGWQYLDDDRRCTPLGYFHPEGGVGQVLTILGSQHQHLGVIGLGSGALAAYCKPHQSITFFEIDHVVQQIAENDRFFSYLQGCCMGKYRVELGDGRLSLRRQPNEHFGVIVIDAFSSDAIPVHLLTVEAIAEYREKLAPGGIIIFHVSNRYLDLEPVLNDVGHALGMTVYGNPLANAETVKAQTGPGMHEALLAQFVILANNPIDVQPLLEKHAWRELPPRPAAQPWTDNCSNLVGALRW